MKEGFGVLSILFFPGFVGYDLSAIKVHDEVEFVVYPSHSRMKVGDVPDPDFTGSFGCMCGFGFLLWCTSAATVVELLSFSEHPIKGRLRSNINTLIC